MRNKVQADKGRPISEVEKFLTREAPLLKMRGYSQADSDAVVSSIQEIVSCAEKLGVDVPSPYSIAVFLQKILSVGVSESSVRRVLDRIRKRSTLKGGSSVKRK